MNARRIPLRRLFSNHLAIVGMALMALSCRRHPSAPSQPPAPGTPFGTTAASAFATNGAPQPSSPTAPAPAPAVISPWCVQSLPDADARAIDSRGHVIALRDGAIVDETAGTAPVRLPRMTPRCAVHLNHLAFARDGSGLAVVDGRIYIKPSNATWVATPGCTDLLGDPWSPRHDGTGWVVVGRRFAATEPAMLQTDDPTARTGWLATMALDPTTTALALEGSGSFVSLTSGGHALFVDRTRVVAGELLAASDSTWPSLSRTDDGIVLSRDESPTRRALVVGSGVSGTFARERRERPIGRETLQVFAAEFGRLVAVTRDGVEWGAERGAAFVEVARWPSGDRARGDLASLGWIDDALPAVVTPSAIAGRRCPVMRANSLRTR